MTLSDSWAYSLNQKARGFVGWNFVILYVLAGLFALAKAFDHPNPKGLQFVLFLALSPVTLVMLLKVIFQPFRPLYEIVVLCLPPALLVSLAQTGEWYGVSTIVVSSWVVANFIASFAPQSDQEKRLATTGSNGQPSSSEDDLGQFKARKARFGFDKIVGMDELKAKLVKIGSEVKPNKKKYVADADVRNGVLLFGEPGNGKTFIAEAFAGEMGLPLVELRYGDVASRWVNQTTEGVKAAFTAAVKQAPCVLFIDEVDSFIEDRTGAGSGGESVRTTNTILTALVDIRGKGVVVMAATNFLDRLDSAAIREGRFDYKVEIPAPDLPARKAILSKSLAKRMIEVDDPTLTRACTRWSGFSAARLNTIGIEVGDILKERNETLATFEVLAEALRRVQGHKGKLPENTPTLSDIALNAESRERLTAIANRMKYVEKIEQLGGTVPSGVLFYGPPGTGKTLTVRALAKTTGWAFIATSGADLLQKPQRIDEILEDAANLRPCIVFIDEADDVLGERTSFGSTAAITNKILAAMDGSGGKVPDIIFVAATNHPDSMDSAALRGGRFTEKVKFSLPDTETIETFLQGWMAKSVARFDHTISPSDIAHLLVGMAMADIVEVLKLATNRMVDRQLNVGTNQSVGIADIRGAISDINYR